MQLSLLPKSIPLLVLSSPSRFSCQYRYSPTSLLLSFLPSLSLRPCSPFSPHSFASVSFMCPFRHNLQPLSFNFKMQIRFSTENATMELKGEKIYILQKGRRKKKTVYRKGHGMQSNAGTIHGLRFSGLPRIVRRWRRCCIWGYKKQNGEQKKKKAKTELTAVGLQWKWTAWGKWVGRSPGRVHVCVKRWEGRKSQPERGEKARDWRLMEGGIGGGVWRWGKRRGQELEYIFVLCLLYSNFVVLIFSWG